MYLCPCFGNDVCLVAAKLPKRADSANRNQPKFLFFETCMRMRVSVREVLSFSGQQYLQMPIIAVTEQPVTKKNRGTISMSTCGGSVRILYSKVLPERAKHTVSPNWWYACAPLSLMQRMPLAKS